MARHDAILRESVEAHGGVVFSRWATALRAAFGSAPRRGGGGDRRAAAVGKRGVGRDWTVAWCGWGLHTDEGAVRAPGRVRDSQPLNRCARLMAVGHGGQVLLSRCRRTTGTATGCAVEASWWISVSIGCGISASPCTCSSSRTPVCRATSRRCGHWTHSRGTCRGRRRRSSAATKTLLGSRRCSMTRRW